MSAKANPADLDRLRGQELTARLQARRREGPVRRPGTEQEVPRERVNELLARRAAAVREGLVKGEGIREYRPVGRYGASFSSISTNTNSKALALRTSCSTPADR